MRSCMALVAGLLLSGCGGGPPTRFYTLAPTPPGTAITSRMCQTRPVSVQRVLLPEALDRQSMVRANGTAQLIIVNQDRWAAPLDSMIRHALAEDLRARLPSGRVLLPGDVTPPGGAAGLNINILRFLGDSDGKVTLRADWTLPGRQGKPSQIHSVSIDTQASSSRASDLAAAMSQAVGKLADRIAGVLRGCS